MSSSNLTAHNNHVMIQVNEYTLKKEAVICLYLKKSKTKNVDKNS